MVEEENMSKKNLGWNDSKLEWNKHQRRKVVRSPLDHERAKFFKFSGSSGGDLVLPPIPRGSQMDDDKYVGTSSSIRCLEIETTKPVIGHRRQPKNSCLANGLSRCDRADEEEKTEMRIIESELGDKNRRFRVSIPIGKKGGENRVKDACAMEIIEEENFRCNQRSKETNLTGLEDGKDTELEEEVKQIEHDDDDEEEEEEEEGCKQIKHDEAVEEEVKHIEVMALDEEEKGVKAIIEDELRGKIWNLRPRKPIRQLMNLNGSNLSYGACPTSAEYPSQKKQVAEKKKEAVRKEETKKRWISVALKKEDIKEDLLLLGLKPSKKPAKRSRSVQNQVDFITPGKALDSIPITTDLYRVSRRDVGLM